MIDFRRVTWACTLSLTPAPDSSVGSTLKRRRGGSKTAELQSEEVEPAGVESDASGKDQADVWFEESEFKPVNVEAGCAESEDEDEQLYVFPQCAHLRLQRLLPKREPCHQHR